MPRPAREVGALDKVNFIIESWAHPCEAPWYIYIETLKPALLTAFITLITFGWDDVLRGWWRPRGLGHRTGKRKGKRSGRGIPRFPELGELIGSQLPNAEEIKGTKWGSGVKTLWRIDTVIQQALFKWLVADVTLDLAYNWTSLLYETVWCQTSGTGRFASHEPGQALKPGNQWNVMSFSQPDYQEGSCFWVVITGNSGDKPCTVTCAASFKEWSGVGEPTEIGFRVTNSLTGELYHQTGPLPAEQANNLSAVSSGVIPAGQVFKCWSWHNAVAALIEDGVVVGHQDE